MHSAAEGYGGEGEDQLLQLHHHHHHHHQDSMMYHVPQHSRREKLRFPPEDSLPLLLHDPNTSPPPLYHPSTLTTTFLPASSASACCYYAQNPNEFSPLHLPIPHHQPFSLSLSPSSSAPPPRHHVSSDVGAPRNTGPLGPFTGYAAVLNRSGFLQPARVLLEEMCHVVRGAAAGGGDASHPADPLSAAHHAMEDGLDRPIPGVEQHQWKKIGLISLLDEVCKKYRQYYQQVQAVITSFESVAGLSTAAPYAFMALKVMRKHFKCLKSAISDQLHHSDKEYQNEGLGKEENSGFVVDHSGVYLQKAANNSGSLGQPHAWRPQRGLPERAVAVLRAWLFEHFLHPYPSDTEKQMLAKQTGLSRNQVSNWFINARVRLWKPMVEEIHSLEMRELHNVAADDRNHTTSKQAQPPSASTATPSNNQTTPKTSIQKNQNPSSKRFRDELTQMPNPIEQPFSLVYDDLSSHHRVRGGGGGVSLTLGLQNNGVCLPEPIPLNLVRRFGFEECSDAYVVGAFEGSDRLFGKDIGGHFLHDFAG